VTRGKRWDRTLAVADPCLATVGRLTVNHRAVDAPADRILLRLLRDDLGLTGTKEGCSGGQCGTCTVLVDGQAIPSCRTTVGDVSGREITTIEGIGTPHALHPLQRAFVEIGAVQCGFCTPGMILGAKALLDRSPHPSREEILSALDRHLCRCTGYTKIIEAVQLGSRYLLGEADASCVAAERQQLDHHWRSRGERSPVSNGLVGRSEPRIDVLSKVLGRTLYGADLYRVGQLQMLAVRSPHAHARILDISTDGALSVPGVVTVLTAADVPGPNALSFFRQDQPVLAEGKVRHAGEAVALVVAETLEAAEIGREAVRVEYQPLQWMMATEAASARDAALVHEGVTNEFFVRRLERDDPEKALATADVVVEGDFTTPHNEHAYLEPEAGIAYLEEDRVVVETGTQDAHQCRDQIARILALPPARVDVRRSVMGGGFGGKLDLVLPALLGLAAYRTGRPVRMVYTREESLLITPKRHPYRMSLRLGASNNGTLTALSAEIVGDAGAYATLSPGVITRSVLHMTGPYRIPAVSVAGRGVYTNGPPCGAMRGFGVPQVTFALECLLDELADQLDMDPFELRLHNALRADDRTATGQELDSSTGYVQTLEALRPQYVLALDEAAEFNQSGGRTTRGLRRGVGVAGMWYGTGKTALSEGADVGLELLSDGRIRVITTAADLGQGLETVLAQLVAEKLSLPLDRVLVSTDATNGSPDGGGTGGNRQTCYIGNAALAAADQLKACMIADAAEMLGRPVDELVLRDGAVRVASNEADRVPFKELYDAGMSRRCQGSYHGTSGALDNRSQGVPYDGYSYGCQMAEVEVDTRTGRVRVRRITVAHDVGRALNPQAVEGQLHGGVMMGLGFALKERYTPGKTHDLGRYHLPRFHDVPEIHLLPLASGRGKGPFGSAGIGECSLLPTAPAIVNAISSATGGRPRELPVTAASLRNLMVVDPLRRERKE